MRSRKDDRRIQRFLALSALILLTPWILIAGLLGMENVQDGVLGNGGLQVALIGNWKARRSNR